MRQLFSCVITPGLALVLAFPAPGWTGDSPWPASPAEAGVVFENVEYRFQVREYRPHRELVPVTREKASYATPEDAATAYFSALFAVDRAWWKASWVEAAGERTDRAAREAEASAKDELARATFSWERIQRDEYRGKEIEFTHRIDTGRFVALLYEVEDPRQTVPHVPPDPPRVVVLREENGRWLVTDELRKNDPVLQLWSNPGATARTIGR
jgi:hypothetical protein